jgi:secretion/DNA translocation related TadE-like protein
VRAGHKIRDSASNFKSLRACLWKLEHGSATGYVVGFLAVMATLLSSLGVAFGLGLGVIKTQALADLAALNAADTLMGAVAGFPCENAELVINANGAQLTTCRIVGLVAQVSVSTNLGPFQVSRWAEAG